MPVRDDILSFMRSIKSGKQAVKETEFKQEAVTQAQAQYDQTLEDYARNLTAYESELPAYQQRVADWETNISAQQAAHEAAVTAHGNQSTPQWQAYNSWTPQITEYRHVTYPNGTSKPPVVTWDTNQFGSDQSRVVANPVARPAQPTAPTAPTYAPQPEMTNAFPGDMPSFEFVMPDTPYASALAKSSQMDSVSGVSSRDRQMQQYYQAVNAQASQPKWWQR